MAITTYSELQTAVANWLAKSNLTNRIPEFIALLEAKVNRKLSVMDMSVRAQATTTATGYIGLPTDYRGLRYVKVVSSTPEVELIYYTPQSIHAKEINQQSGPPKIYTIVDDQLYVRPKGAGHTVEIVYTQKVPALSDSNTTNWLLTSHPDIYLYGALMAAEPFNRNDERTTLWATLTQSAMEELETMDAEIRWSGAPLTASVRSSTP